MGSNVTCLPIRVDGAEVYRMEQFRNNLLTISGENLVGVGSQSNDTQPGGHEILSSTVRCATKTYETILNRNPCCSRPG